MGIVKRVILVLVGFVPLLLGYLIRNGAMASWAYNNPLRVIFLITFITFLLWFVTGWIFTKLAVPRVQIILLLNVGIVALGMLQMISLLFGLAAQFIFLPGMLWAVVIAPTFFVLSVIAFVLLILAPYLGTKVGARKCG